MKIELVARGGKTELTLSHEGLPDQEMADSHNGGWSSFLDSLTKRLA